MLNVVDGTLDGIIVEGIAVEVGIGVAVTVESVTVAIVEDASVPGSEDVTAVPVPGSPIIDVTVTGCPMDEEITVPGCALLEDVTGCSVVGVTINEDVTAQPGELTEALYWK